MGAKSVGGLPATRNADQGPNPGHAAIAREPGARPVCSASASHAVTVETRRESGRPQGKRTSRAATAEIRRASDRTQGKGASRAATAEIRRASDRIQGKGRTTPVLHRTHRHNLEPRKEE